MGAHWATFAYQPILTAQVSVPLNARMMSISVQVESTLKDALWPTHANGVHQTVQTIGVQYSVPKMKCYVREDLIKICAQGKIFAFQLKTEIAQLSVLPSVVKWSKCALGWSMPMVVLNLIFVFLPILAIPMKPFALSIAVKMNNYAQEAKVTPISAYQLITNPPVVGFANLNVDQTKSFVMEVLMKTVAKCKGRVNILTLLLFVITNALSTAHQTNGHVSWDRMRWVAKTHRPAQSTANALKFRHLVKMQDEDDDRKMNIKFQHIGVIQRNTHLILFFLI